ncbi:MAG: RluA family pseudouridine synthase [Eubacterium sp.]|nr:RluA family pseudouridine synthase [Eubacterium sp.]
MDNIFIVDESTDHIRIDKYLNELLPDQSRSYIQKLLKDGHILVNNSIIKPNYKVKADDRIQIDIPEPIEANIEAENIPLDIIYEDNDVLIVNKPKEMVVHPAPGNYSGTLVNALMYHCKNSLSNINGVLRPGIVHRIDKNTTGCLIVCKNDQSHNFVADQLSEHSINRIYVGIVCGVLKDDEGTIDAPIGRNKRDRKLMSVNEDGKRAITHYKVLKRFRDYTLVQFKLETGRTHQIRVHMAHINHPLLGDDQYGRQKCKFNLTGQCLHAKTIGFIHPSTKEYVEFEVDEPEYFKHLLDILEE